MFQKNRNRQCQPTARAHLIIVSILLGAFFFNKRYVYSSTPPSILHTSAELVCPPCPLPAAHILQNAKMEMGQESKGQVTRETPLGMALYNLSKDPSIVTILETGTLDGTGATKCIVDGIQDSGSGWLITIEAVKESFEMASRNLAGKPVKTLWGSPVDPADMPSKPEVRRVIDQAFAAQNGFTFPAESSWGHWWDGEEAMIKEHEVGLLGPLCRKYRQTTSMDDDKRQEYSFDLMVLDSGEFTGWAEYQVAITECRPRYIAFHDTQAFKHWFSVQELLKENSGYESFDMGFDRVGTGHAIFKRVK